MEDTFFNLLTYVIFFIERVGVIIIVISVLRSLYNLIFVNKFDFVEARKDMGLSTGLSVALEFILAAEILKTISLRSQSELIYIGVLIMIRIVMTFVIHRKLKQKEMEEAIKEGD